MQNQLPSEILDVLSGAVEYGVPLPKTFYVVMATQYGMVFDSQLGNWIPAEKAKRGFMRDTDGFGTLISWCPDQHAWLRYGEHKTDTTGVTLYLDSACTIPLRTL